MRQVFACWVPACLEQSELRGAGREGRDEDQE